MGYHKKKIEKGHLQHFSKIKEEFEELEDAHEQGNIILELCELCDLIGAIEAYIGIHNLCIGDLFRMSNATKEAFKDGTRK